MANINIKSTKKGTGFIATLEGKRFYISASKLSELLTGVCEYAYINELPAGQGKESPAPAEARVKDRYRVLTDNPIEGSQEFLADTLVEAEELVNEHGNGSGAGFVVIDAVEGIVVNEGGS